ncbi:hypothetical protein VC83_03097 [Pseudogymnoascus destructans]|uniref:Uncharacterized protein n=1 Tax=Pseudogymnoascus destructans TaxID=655981 RepID=A0A177ADP2_9PEZI|nr:uncharacterized protein VC83_03097 [Pseudogymnoascus destructans]OAF60225.1 hypothetical protein VC83_03097 [Pseudogymnoascus destructans]
MTRTCRPVPWGCEPELRKKVPILIQTPAKNSLLFEKTLQATLVVDFSTFTSLQSGFIHQRSPSRHRVHTCTLHCVNPAFHSTDHFSKSPTTTTTTTTTITTITTTTTTQPPQPPQPP